MNKRIAVQPIIDVIQGRGGLANCFPQEEVWVDTMPEGGKFGDTMRDAGGYVKTRIHPDYRTAFDRHKKRIARAQTVGHIDVFHADEFCIDVLGVHPHAVYGWSWYEFDQDQPAELAA